MHLDASLLSSRKIPDAFAAVSFAYSQISSVVLLFEKSVGSTVQAPQCFKHTSSYSSSRFCAVQHVAITFSQPVAVGKSSLTSVFLSSVKGDVLCDFECGPTDVARTQVRFRFISFPFFFFVLSCTPLHDVLFCEGCLATAAAAMRPQLPQVSLRQRSC